MNNSIEEIKKVINNSNYIVIGGHTNPDGDAIGSCCALANALLRREKKVTVILEHFSEKYHMIPGLELIQYEGYENIQPDLFISLDCGDKERLGVVGNIFDRCNNINIDHHASNTYFGKYNYVDDKASSTCELIYRLLEGYIDLDKDIASALYTGLIYDTGGFKHSSTSAITMKIVSVLLEYQIPFTEIYETIFFDHTFSEIKLMGRALEKAKLTMNGKIIYSFITLEEMNELNGTSKELDGVVGYLKSVNGTYASIFFYEKGENEVKVSFRAEDNLNVCKIAEVFGGGGHKKAAGCTMNGCLTDIISKVLAEVKKKC